MTMSCDDTGTRTVRRFEVFTGAGHRREWSDETRTAIIAESYSGVESVSAVARRHALAPSQLFTWRREFRRATQAADMGAAAAAEPEPFFVPAVLDPQVKPAPAGRTPAVRKRRARRAREATAIELEIDGVSVKIARGADAGVIAAVIDALKTAR
jgi:transposase